MTIKICRFLAAWCPITFIIMAIVYIIGFPIAWLMYGNICSVKEVWEDRPFSE